MPISSAKQGPSRGHKKKARTREQLIEAGLQVLADKGEALTISDVVERAQVSNGTFYNYFSDRDALVDALAERSLVALAAESALRATTDDPAQRFAVATAAVLSRAVEDPTWGRVVLRLTGHRRTLDHEVTRSIRKDLASGFEAGHFAFGPDEVTLDVLVGLNTMAIRRIVQGDAGRDYVQRVVERALTILGVSAEKAAKLATDVVPR